MDADTPPDPLRGLTPEQREAVTSSARRLVVRASAGSGKTHVLTLRIQRRIESGELEPDQILAMTFTRKAGDELRRRLLRAGIRDVRAGTFHRAALTIVSQFRNDHGLRPLVVEPQRRRLVGALVSQLRDAGTPLEEYLLPRLEAELSWALSQGLEGAAYARAVRHARRDVPLGAAGFADFIDRYVGLCRARGVLDFDLLLQEAISLLRSEPALAEGFRHRTRALFVDETQDMNPLQFSLLRHMGGADPDLFCVGDPQQSIYGFNGASPSLMDEIGRTWPDVVTLDLTRNHRSTAAIVTVASTLLDEGARAITPAREGGEIPRVRAYENDGEEARQIARWLSLRHHEQAPWMNMAVLSRTNAQLDLVASALELADIPFERRGAEHSPASDLVAEWSRQPRTEERDAVALSTIHRAKGLEFAHVVVMGFAEGLLPHYNATTSEQLAEEQRLAYVALSRAEESLLITWSARGESRVRRPSRFLPPVEAAIAELESRNAPLTGDRRRARLAAIREMLESTEEPS
ncbi:MAG: ATP-dependent helicase [Acidobacteria bacterium]|nr:ATP-dependent helicase [Acidobacteriota bacterium]